MMTRGARRAIVGHLRTDGDGCFEIRAVPGAHQCFMYVSARGCGTEEQVKTDTDRAADGHMRLPDLVLARADLTIAGIVVAEDGEPVPGTRVAAYGEGQPKRLLAHADEQGDLLVAGVCTGQVQLVATAPRPQVPVTSVRGEPDLTRLGAGTIAEGGATDVRIAIPGGLAGRVSEHVPRTPRVAIPRTRE